MSDLEQRIAALSPEKRELLLRRLGEQRNASAQSQIPRRSPDQDSLPLSFAQESLWFVDQLAAASAAYTVPIALRLRGPLNVAALDQSLQEIINRHEALRSAFPAVNGRPTQVIAPSLSAPLSVVDLQAAPEAEREQRAWQHIDAEMARPFDLARGPLLRATLLRLAEQEHILALLTHHIIADGWSTGILLRELTALYDDLSAGQPSPLPDLPIQYADYALWQRERLQGAEFDRLLAYWKQQLAGAPAVLELPTEYPRPAIQTFRGARCSFHLPAALAEQLRALSRQEQASLFITLLAAFQALLSRYTGQDDMVVGSPIANRSRAETQGLIGYLVNMLPLRADLSGNPSFRDLLRQVRATALEAYAHQDFPIEKLVEALQPERSLSYTPLFQVTFALEQAIPPGMGTGGLTWSLLEPGSATAKFDLDLTLREGDKGLSGVFEYSTDLFEARAIERLAGHWQTLLEGIAANPDQPIATLPLLTQAERQQLLRDWNATQVDYPQEHRLHHLFEQQVERSPDAVAVVYEGTALTYRALNSRANQLARYLQARGVKPDTLVGVYMERSLEMVIALLGILKAGGAYVPLDPGYPPDRLAFMLEDAQAAVLLTQARLAAALPASQARVCRVDADWEQIAREDTANPTSAVAANHLAYLIYTSGSTGKPKGVMNTHRGICNRLLWMQDEYQLGGDDRVLQKTPFSFDVSVWEFFWPLITGARLVVARPEGHKDSAYLCSLIAEQQITTIHFVPSMLQAFLEERQIAECRSLRRVLCSGEALPFEVQERCFQRLAAPLHNLYGPTEAAVDVTYWACKEEPGRRTVPIGRPIANTQIYLLDRAGQPVPIGLPGELHIGGVGVARGYLNRPELTAERFIPDPFSAQPDARLYKTGDLARYRPDGNIEYIGRMDFQVKLRGFRIELGEIETALQQHPAVREVVVVAREAERGDKRLVAYVVPQPGQRVTPQEVRAFLKASLPEYMLPSALVLLDAFPLSPNGKLDRKALPAPEASERPEEERFVAPTLIEHYQLLEIWEELLEARPIGIKDNFFLLGGHSLLAIRLVARIEEVFGKKISLAALFTGPTIEEITVALQQQEEHSSRAPIFPVQVGGARRPLFFMHGAWTGGGFYCYRLARELGPEQPFYALQPYRLDGLSVPPTFEAMAAAHLEAIRAVQPEGPYILGGFCNGGMVAAEMTRQLQAQGQKVELLVMVDPSSPARISQRLARGIIRRVGGSLGFAEEKQLDIYLRFRSIFAYARDIYRYARSPKDRQTAIRIRGKRGMLGLALPELSLLAAPPEKLREEWAAVHLWTLPGRVAEFKADRLAFFWSSRGKIARGLWDTLAAAKGAEVHSIPGWHSNWRAEKIHALAEQLNVCLSNVEAPETSREELAAS